MLKRTGWIRSQASEALVLCAALLAAAATAPLARAEDMGDGDAYPDYAHLAAQQHEGVDYQIELTDQASPITVMAIHGGGIEPGATEIARLIAGGQWNFYSFEGLKPAGRNGVLHVTSTHFDEPRAMALAERSDSCLSMHGFFQEQGGPSIACVGGGNAVLASAVADALRAGSSALGLRVEYPCLRFAGRDPKNIVNRCKNQGVQVEMSPTLRLRIRNDAEFAGRLADTLRGAFGAAAHAAP